MENNDELLKKKAQYFFDNSIMVHVQMKNERFLNGLIKYIGADFFIVIDRKLGDYPIFLMEVENISPYVKLDGGGGE